MNGMDLMDGVDLMDRVDGRSAVWAQPKRILTTDYRKRRMKIATRIHEIRAEQYRDAGYPSILAKGGLPCACRNEPWDGPVLT
jgi:hypothetical protein